jgi:pantoate--beta-alanine ligase
VTEIITSLAQWRTLASNMTTPIGFVPTMGNFHPGHMALMARARRENPCVVVSVFVNPIQFNDPADYTAYPRTLARDIELADQAGVDYLLAPDEAQMYPETSAYRIEEDTISQRLEGVRRPGHFAGMLTVVMKLLQIVKPARAYFGEKDYQQLQLVRELVTAFFLDTTIVPCPTVRDDSGLPLSSRNSRLTAAKWQVAQDFARVFHQARPLEEIREQLSALPLALEYLQEYDQRRFVAVRIDDVRLIDNYALAKEACPVC